MRRHIIGFAVLFLALADNSCVLRPRAVVAAPNVSLRTSQEEQLSLAAWDHAKCYFGESSNPHPSEPSNVEELIAQCKLTLINRLRKIDNTKGLQDYFEKFYPTVGDALSAVPLTCLTCPPADRAPIPQSLKRIAYPPGSDNPPAAESDSRAQRMLSWLVAWVDERLIYRPDSRRFLVSLAVNSEPKPEATVTLRHLDKSPVGSVPTQGAFPEVYRGLYHCEIKRAQFKTYDSENSKAYLNLVDWTWTSAGMTCKLVPESSALDAQPCILH